MMLPHDAFKEHTWSSHCKILHYIFVLMKQQEQSPIRDIQPYWGRTLELVPVLGNMSVELEPVQQGAVIGVKCHSLQNGCQLLLLLNLQNDARNGRR
jgi:hypothetical protein